MRTVFIADAHLVSPADRNYRSLCTFLEEIAGTIEALYIMGDLFDFWVELKDNSLQKLHLPLLQVLDKVKSAGADIVYFEGNHDFNLSRFFMARYGAEVHDKPAVKIIQGKKIYLCHGDQLNHRDFGYRLLRALLRSRLVASLAKHLPSTVPLAIKERLQKNSRNSYPSRQIRWNYPEIIREAGKKLASEGLDVMVTGHFHLPLCEIDESSGFTIVALGEWIDSFNYGTMENGTLKLNSYHFSG